MQISEIRPNVYYIKFDKQYDAALTMIRMQEFYESPYPSIRGKHFTLEEYMDEFAKEFGFFDYDVRWGGWNIPGHILTSFYHRFDDLREKEVKFFDLLLTKKLDALDFPIFKNISKFYVIAGAEEDIIVHELAHAYYDLNEQYKEEMDALISQLPTDLIESTHTKLLKVGYDKSVLSDEIQAYFVDNIENDKDVLYERYLSQDLRIVSNKFYEVFKRYDYQPKEV